MYSIGDMYVSNINIPNFFIISDRFFSKERQDTLYSILMVMPMGKVKDIVHHADELNMLIRANNFHIVTEEEKEKIEEIIIPFVAKRLLLGRTSAQ